MERESTGRPAPDFLPKSVDPPKEFEADYARKREAIETALTRFETPFYLYDEVGIRSTAARLRTLFGWAPEYREYYAVKALPNPEVLRILNEEGCGADASSGPELLLAKAVGIEGEAVMFTSNNTDPREFRQAADDGAIINFDDLTQLEAYRREVGPYPDLVCLRFQPDPEAFEGNEIIGTTAPKFGMSADQIGEGIHHLKRRGVKRFGLHTMPVSNELSAAKLGEASRLFVNTAVDLSQRQNVEFDFLNFGGGFGIPYRPYDDPLDVEKVAQGIRIRVEDEITHRPEGPLGNPRIFTELGRYVTGPHGVLVTKVRHVMEKQHELIGVDATMADLMRPGMYGAYHYLTVLGHEGEVGSRRYDVVGSLCEDNDKFAVQRHLPPVSPRDTLVIHDAGAHARAMGFNYNGKLRCGEILLRADGTLQEIRRAETPDDYFATLPDDWRAALQAAEDRLEEPTKD